MGLARRLKLRQEQWMMLPDSPWRLSWDILMILNCFLACLIIPGTLSYCALDSPPLGVEITLKYFVDLLWPIDIIMNCRTGFYSMGEVECRWKPVIRNYIVGWFTLDLLGALPLAFIETGSTVYVIVCIFKLVHMFRSFVRFKNIRDAFFGMSGLLPTFVTMMVFLFTHLMTCIWRRVLRIDSGALGLSSWSHCTNMTEFLEAYVSDFYWAATTLTSVGYGDIVPLGVSSKLFAVFAMLVGSLGFGATVSLCSLFMQKMLNNEAEKMIGDLTYFMNRRSVPMLLQRRVRDNLKTHLMFSSSSSMAPHLLASLSPAMQRELCLSILSDTVLQFPLFKNAPRAFASELAQAHVWQTALAGDLVTDEGHAVQQVVFLVEGALQAWISAGHTHGQLDAHVSHHLTTTVPEASSGLRVYYSEQDSDSVIATEQLFEMRSGAWFGEASLFDEERVYTASISALTKCELAVLPQHEYFTVVQKYPWIHERHELIKKSVLRGKLSLKLLKYHEGITRLSLTDASTDMNLPLWSRMKAAIKQSCRGERRSSLSNMAITRISLSSATSES
jgi:CRP-like cAMP-binding protein